MVKTVVVSFLIRSRLANPSIRSCGVSSNQKRKNQRRRKRRKRKRKKRPSQCQLMGYKHHQVLRRRRV